MPTAGASILLVPTAYENGDALMNQLRQSGCVIEISDAVPATKKIPDLILLRLGEQAIPFLHRLRASHSSDAIPVILLVDSDDSQRLVAALDAGADEYIRDPLNSPRLIESIRSRLRVKRLAAEVEQRRRIEDELRLSEERFAKAFRSSPDGLTLSHRDTGVIFDCNDSFLKIFGYPREQVIGHSSLDLGMIVDPADRTRAIDELRRTGMIRDFEAPGRRRNGEIFPVALQAEAIQIAGKPCVLSIVRDDTERHRARQAMRLATGQLERRVQERTVDLQRAIDALSESEQRFRMIADRAPVLLWMTDTQGKCCFVNKSWSELTGRKPEDEMGYGWADALHPDDRERCLTLWRAAFNARARFEMDYRIRAADGQYRWLYGTAMARITPDGQFAGYMGSSIDVTDRRESEDLLRRVNAALRESEERFRTMADSAPMLLWIDGPDGACQFLNKSWLRFTGRTLEQELGFGWVESIHRDDRERCLQVYTEARKARAPLQLEYRLRRADGVYRWILDTSIPRFDSLGQFAGHIGSCMDITERRQAEEILRRSNEELDQRVRLRTEELARSNAALLEEIAERRAAHEKLLEYQARLRGLASQVTLAEEKERRRIARGLHDQIGQGLAVTKMRLGSLAELATDREKIKDVEEIRSAIDTAIQHIRSLTFDLGSRILYEFGLEAAIENLAEKLHTHGIQSSFYDAHDPKPLEEDVRVIVFQAVRELLHNVAKHAHAHHVKVSVSREGDFLRVDVQDDGVGFDAKALTGNLTHTRGFGLFNLREQLNYVGGRLELNSYPGSGTHATLFAPIRRLPKEPAPQNAGVEHIKSPRIPSPIQ